jgi:hypothetical protein
MASQAHQVLLLWVVRKMAADGFVVGGCEGPLRESALWDKLQGTPTIGSVRPDAWGVTPTADRFAFGEAKTTDDIVNAHTRKQLVVFGRLVHRETRALCHLYVAVCRSDAPALDRVLAQAGLLGLPHVIRLHIPDCLIAEYRHDCI